MVVRLEFPKRGEVDASLVLLPGMDRMGVVQILNCLAAVDFRDDEATAALAREVRLETAFAIEDNEKLGRIEGLGWQSYSE